MTAQLITEWSSPDPRLAEMLRGIAGLPERSPERLAAEAALHTWQAEQCYRSIGQIEVERRAARRRRTS